MSDLYDHTKVKEAYAKSQGDVICNSPVNDQWYRIRTDIGGKHGWFDDTCYVCNGVASDLIKENTDNE